MLAGGMLARGFGQFDGGKAMPPERSYERHCPFAKGL